VSILPCDDMMPLRPLTSPPHSLSVHHQLLRPTRIQWQSLLLCMLGKPIHRLQYLRHAARVESVRIRPAQTDYSAGVGVLHALSTTAPASASTSTTWMPCQPCRQLAVPPPHHPHLQVLAQISTRHLLLRHRELRYLLNLQLRHSPELQRHDMHSRIPLPEAVPTPDLQLHLLWQRRHRLRRPQQGCHPVNILLQCPRRLYRLWHHHGSTGQRLHHRQVQLPRRPGDRL